MRSYEDLQYAFRQLELAALYWGAGKLDAFIAATGSMLWGDEDFLYTHWYELLERGRRIIRISAKTRTRSPAG